MCCLTKKGASASFFGGYHINDNIYFKMAKIHKKIALIIQKNGIHVINETL